MGSPGAFVPPASPRGPPAAVPAHPKVAAARRGGWGGMGGPVGRAGRLLFPGVFPLGLRPLLRPPSRAHRAALRPSAALRSWGGCGHCAGVGGWPCLWPCLWPCCGAEGLPRPRSPEPGAPSPSPWVGLKVTAAFCGMDPPGWWWWWGCPWSGWLNCCVGRLSHCCPHSRARPAVTAAMQPRFPRGTALLLALQLCCCSQLGPSPLPLLFSIPALRAVTAGRSALWTL